MAGTKTIEVLETVAGNDYAYTKGMEYEAPDYIADDLIQAGYARLKAKRPSQAAEKAVSPHAKNAEKR